MDFLLMAFAFLLLLNVGDCEVPKRGLSGLGTCQDAVVLNLTNSWHYNWGLHPSGHSGCPQPQIAEFAPMFWSCYGNCTTGLVPDYKEVWQAAGVKYILGFNEPDNKGQANLTPQKAAEFWPQLQEVALSFSPPLALVSPAMTHWDLNGSVWLDQFFANCTNIPDCDPSLIVAVAFHDYSGSAAGIIGKAEAANKRYKRPVWLTEFAKGNGKDRGQNDDFMGQILEPLDHSSAIQRYAWFSTRNVPGSWVAESSLLPYNSTWQEAPKSSCSSSSQMWMNQHKTLAECEEAALASSQCVMPKTIAYEVGPNHNCYCANTTCIKETSSWLDLYEYKGSPPGNNMTPTSTGNLYIPK